MYLRTYILMYVQGYSAGALERAVRAIVTRRRVLMLHDSPITSTDFIDQLALQDVTYKDDKMVTLVIYHLLL